MNKAIDVYLNDMKESIINISEEDIRADVMLSAIVNAAQRESFVDKCPFCGGDAAISMYSNAAEVMCNQCKGRGPLVTDASDMVKTDMMMLGEIIDHRFRVNKEESDEGGPLCDIFLSKFRNTTFAIACWWAIAQWNRRD